MVIRLKARVEDKIIILEIKQGIPSLYGVAWGLIAGFAPTDESNYKLGETNPQTKLLDPSTVEGIIGLFKLIGFKVIDAE